MHIQGNKKRLQSGRRALFVLSCSAAAVISGCGGTGQDDGQIAATQQSFSGAVIDGYLARSTVFVDANNNGTRDPWESFAFTDNEGYYSYNPLTDTDYCAADATEQQQLYCLRSFVAHEDVVIRVDGGYDVLTGEPFLGQMTRRVNAAQEDGTSDNLITPLTTLMTSVTSPEESSQLLTSLGLEEADLDIDYLNSDGNGGVDAELLNKALTIHKAVTVLADRLNDTYTEIGDNFGTPNDASSAVYPALAAAVKDNGLDLALQPQSLYGVLDVAEDVLREVYERKDLNPPPDMGSALAPEGFARIAEVVSDIPQVVDVLINTEGVLPTAEDVAGKARALESLVIKAVNENAQIDPSIANAVDFFTDSANEPLLGALVDSLAAETADLGSLSTNDFSGSDFDSILEIAQSSSIPEGVTPFNRIGGYMLRLSDMDLGQAPDKLDDSEIEFYFDGAPTDLEGEFSACVKIVENAKSDGTLGEGNTRGDIADGFWSMLGSTEANTETFSLLVTINFLGTTYSGIIKPAGTEVIDGVQFQAIRFDNDGKLETWHSADGFVEGGRAPVDHNDCQQRLPSRVGI
ncbi:hypothetical protein AB833_20965 [Chromatiales bacterium (ex Bugula neritina AB1)]|nr:hypothetical protein AB833_20965 [Chromatiales bacterium (ex Bugula neritina AB1)]